MTCMALRSPPRVQRGTRKQVNPASLYASVRNASLMGAEQNHLCPVSVNVPSLFLLARVVFARTSEPPCFSVIAMPMVTAVFPAAGTERGSYMDARIFGVHCAARSGWWRNAATD